MSLVLMCDVCDEQFLPEDQLAQLAFPSEWVTEDPEVDRERLTIDVCSVECLANMASRILGGTEAQVEPVTGEQPEPRETSETRGRFSSVPETAQAQYQDPTGVRIKTLGGQQ